MSVTWNLWHGCKKYSEGCKNCYVYRQDARYERDASLISKTKAFDLPVQKDKKGNYKIKSGENIGTCFTSDFLLEECDQWRGEAWKMIKERSDCHFLFITKRITRFLDCIPKDWGDGWDNVSVGVTCENQKRADERLPVLKTLPIKHKIIICEPLLEQLDLSKYLDSSIEEGVAGGESGNEARICNYDWILKIANDCKKANIPFWFKQTGARFVKGQKLYKIKRQFQHSQARKSRLSTMHSTAFEDKFD